MGGGFGEDFRKVEFRHNSGEQWPPIDAINDLISRVHESALGKELLALKSVHGKNEPVFEAVYKFGGHCHFRLCRDRVLELVELGDFRELLDSFVSADFQ